MLFGAILTQNSPLLFHKTIQYKGDILSLTNACIQDIHATTSLYLRRDGHQYLIANFNKKLTQIQITLFLNIKQNLALIVKGNGKIHLLGSFSHINLDKNERLKNSHDINIQPEQSQDSQLDEIRKYPIKKINQIKNTKQINQKLDIDSENKIQKISKAIKKININQKKPMINKSKNQKNQKSQSFPQYA